MGQEKKSIFITDDGRNLMFTFILVSSLFLLWGFCNGMIDVMDKHFQEELHLSKAQSAWVQFAHYLGYFLMSMPAGWLASKLGYKGGIVTGLLIVAAGGFWFIPATHINEFWAFLAGVCVIASGLTFLETVANPYTTVLGDPRYAATRINLAQSCNGVGWILGPIAGGAFFYSKNAQGLSTGNQTLYIPYASVAVAVIVIAAVFRFSNIPDIKTRDDYHLDAQDDGAPNGEAAERQVNRGMVYFLLLFNAAVLIGACGMILWVILGTLQVSDAATSTVLWTFGLVSLAAAAALLAPASRKISHHSIWSHPHFSSAVLAQFFYVAAQAGIFSFFINYMTAEVPNLPASWVSAGPAQWFEAGQNGFFHFSDQGAATMQSLGLICFLVGRFSGAGILKKFSAHKVLGLYGAANVAMCLLIFLKLGWLSVVCVFLSYFFMSIMFPTIFALGLEKLGHETEFASSFIVMAISGAAVVPPLMAWFSDMSGALHWSLFFPAFCYLVVLSFGFMAPKMRRAET
jgi:MFS transporter, FHS family, L-fucose permease